eukprot:Lithocolla_globosa_v1_NODE_216_length_5076_cov_24.159729.p1 type:complete len:501 gc:universal NODE_216_length_5076_cov_24.159729:2450-3952(+)
MQSLINLIPSNYKNKPNPPKLKRSEVCKLFRKLRLNQGTGPDNHRAALYKLNSRTLSLIYTEIYQRCVDQGEYLWGLADIRPALKVPLAEEMKDTRPLAHTPIAGKTFQRLLKPDLTEVIQVDQDPLQFAYKKDQSHVDALLTIHDFALKWLDCKPVPTIRFLALDLSSAFHMVEHQKLIQRLIFLICPHWLLILIIKFLSKRRQRVVIGKARSKTRRNTAGSPEGEIWSPDLFTCQTDPIRINNDKNILVKFADDKTLVSKISTEDEFKQHQHHVDTIINKLDKLGFKINLAKNKEVITDTTINQQLSKDLPETLVRGEPVEKWEAIRLLGYILAEDLKPHSHIEASLKKANQKLYLLYKMVSIGLPKEMLKNFVESNILSQLEQASPVFHHSIAADDFEKIEKVQTRAYSSISQIPQKTMASRRQTACDKIFKKMINRKSQLLREGSTARTGQMRSCQSTYKHSRQETLVETTNRTLRYNNSFVPAQTQVYNRQSDKL